MSILRGDRSGTRTRGDLDLRSIFVLPQSACRRGSVKTVNLRIGHVSGLWQFVLNDLHRSSERELIIKCGHVNRLHSNAAETGGTAEQFFFVRAMNVNATAEGVHI